MEKEGDSMKTCTICEATIINGVNGCSMYDTCTTCRPIHYFAKPRKANSIEYYTDYEELILEQQENY